MGCVSGASGDESRDEQGAGSETFRRILRGRSEARSVGAPHLTSSLPPDLAATGDSLAACRDSCGPPWRGLCGAVALCAVATLGVHVAAGRALTHMSAYLHGM